MRPEPRRQQARTATRRAHRRIAVVAVGIIAWFAISGLVLNHATDLALARQPLPNALMHTFYAANVPAGLVGQYIDGAWVSVLDGVLYHGTQRVAACPGGLRGTAVLATLHAIACDDAVHLVSADGTPVERIDAAWGLPGGITALGSSTDNINGHLVIVTLNGTRCLDRAASMLTSCASTPASNWTQRVPDAERAALARALGEQEVDVERFVHDLHSGRLFGTAARWLWDLFALALLALAGSGIVMLRRRG